MSNWKLTDQMLEWREKKVRPASNAQVQKKAQRNSIDYEVDQLAFMSLSQGHPWKYRFLLALYKHQWGDRYALEAQGIENAWAIRMAKAACTERRLTMVGCASSCKSDFGGRYCYTMWKCRPLNTIAHISTTSSEAGEARMWGLIKDLFSQDRWPIGKRIDSLQLITLDSEVKDDEGVKHRDFRNGIKYVKIKTGAEGKNAIAAMCGRKNDFVIWAADEMNFMDIGLLEGRVNMFSNAKPGSVVQFIGIGNGPTEGSPLYIDAEPHGPNFPDGYRSVDIDIHEEWPTRAGKCLYFNGSRSPNFLAVDAKKPPFPFMMNEVSREEIRIASFGEDTNIYWAQFHGFPPSVDVVDKVVTHSLLEKHRAFEAVEWGFREPVVVAGLDLGFKEGGDPSVLDFAKVGPDPEEQNRVEFEREGIVIAPKQTDKSPFETQLAKRVLDECVKRKCHDLALDISGDGGISAMAIKAETGVRGWTLNIIPVSFSGVPDDTYTIPGDSRKASEIFDRKVTQLWMSFRLVVEKGIIRGMSPHCKATRQLCERKMATDERRRFTVEKKRDMRKRLGRSPDDADARVLCALVAMQKIKFVPGKPVSKSVAIKPVEAASRYSGHGSVGRYASR